MKPSDNFLGYDSEDEEQVMASPSQLPTWAKRTLQDAGELVSDPTKARRTRSQFFGDPQALVATKPFLPIHYYTTFGLDPQPHSEAARNSLWEATMDEEYSVVMGNDTWDLVPLLKGRNIVRCQWIYPTKIVVDGEISM